MSDGDGIVVNQASSVTPLNTLVSGAISGTGSFLAQAALKAISEAIFGGKGKSPIETQLEQISNQLEEIRQTQKAILAKIDLSKIAIEKRVVESQIKAAYANILAPHLKMISLFDALKSGVYEQSPDKLKNDYIELTNSINDKVTSAIVLVSQNAIDILELEQQECIKTQASIVEYQLRLSFKIGKLSAIYRTAMDLLVFAQEQHTLLGGIVKNANQYLDKLGAWKRDNVTGALTPLVEFLLDDNQKTFRFEGHISQQKSPHLAMTPSWIPEALGGIFGKTYVSNEGNPERRKPIIFTKADEFLLADPVIHFEFDYYPRDMHFGFINVTYDTVIDGHILGTVYFPNFGSPLVYKWVLTVGDCSALGVSPKDYMCFKNLALNQYAAGVSDSLVKCFPYSPGDPLMFWTLAY